MINQETKEYKTFKYYFLQLVNRNDLLETKFANEES